MKREPVEPTASNRTGNYTERLIRPPQQIVGTRKRKMSVRFVFRYNGGDWIIDDGEPDLSFVVLDNGIPCVYGAEWRNCEKYPNHPNNIAYEAAVSHCTKLYSYALVERIKVIPVEPIPEKKSVLSRIQEKTFIPTKGESSYGYQGHDGRS